MRTLLLWFMLAGAALAVEPGERLADPALEARAREISQELRCVVCQNQSIDDSDAGIARDLRLLVRQRLEQGDTDGAVLDYVVARYGEFVLMRPRYGWHTALLWGAPGVLLVVAGIFLLRRRRREDAPTLSDSERERLDRLLNAD